MAKPKPKYPAVDALRFLIDAEGRLAVRVTPGARSESLEITDGKLLVKVRAKPEDGKANVAVQGLLADALGIAGSKVQLLRGSTAREKMFSIEL